MTLEAPIVRSDATAKSTGRWGQLACGVVCMVMIANLQYGWTLFVNPIDQKYHWGVPAIQVAFTSLSRPKPGWCRSKVGSLIVLARVWLLLLVASSWPSRGRSISSSRRLASASLRCRRNQRCRRGAVYGTCVANALKWFPDRRGLAAGLTAAGFGAGAAATVIPIRNVILGYGYQSAFLWFGLRQGLVVLALSQLLRAPQPGETPKPATRLTQSLREYAPLDMLKSSVFWLLYIMFVLVAGSGLMATAQIAPIAASLSSQIAK